MLDEMSGGRKMNEKSVEILNKELEYIRNIQVGLKGRLDSLSKNERIETSHILGRLYVYSEMVSIFNKMLKN